MSNDELRAKIKALTYPDTDELLGLIHLGLRASNNPTHEQAMLIGEGLGMMRDGGEWHRGAAAETVAMVIMRGCARWGLNVAAVLEILESGICIGSEEYGG